MEQNEKPWRPGINVYGGKVPPLGAPGITLNQEDKIAIGHHAQYKADMRTLMKTSLVLQEVFSERECQDIKWGEQNHDDSKWCHILGEEFGEICRAVNNSTWHDCPETQRKALANLREELIQTAAVCVAWVEAMDRRH